MVGNYCHDQVWVCKLLIFIRERGRIKRTIYLIRRGNKIILHILYPIIWAISMKKISFNICCYYDIIGQNVSWACFTKILSSVTIKGKDILENVSGDHEVIKNVLWIPFLCLLF